MLAFVRREKADERTCVMKKIAMVAGLAAALSAGSFAVADDVTIINRDTDVDTTGSIIIKKPKLRVVVKESPAIVVKQRSDPKVIIKDRDPDLVIKEKRKKLIIDGDID
jgi:hypothetical protein